MGARGDRRRSYGVMTFNFQQYLNKYSLHQTSGGEYTLRCPVCGRDKLIVNADKGLWHCWICQEFKYNERGKRVPVKGAGNVVGLVSLLEGVDYKTAKGIIGSNYANYKSTHPQEYEYSEIPYPPYAQRINYLLPYLQERGITLEDVQYFGLFYCTGGKYNNRLIFPVYEKGKLVFFQGRAMWNWELSGSIKSVNSPKVVGAAGREDILFNLEMACHYPRVVLVEGPIDAIHTGYNGVGTWGKNITDKQIQKLYQYGVRSVDLMWDGPTQHEPEGAIPEMMQALPKLAGLFDTRVIFLPEGDPGDYTREEIKYFVKNGVKANNVSNLNYLS